MPTIQARTRMLGSANAPLRSLGFVVISPLWISLALGADWLARGVHVPKIRYACIPPLDHQTPEEFEQTIIIYKPARYLTTPPTNRRHDSRDGSHRLAVRVQAAVVTRAENVHSVDTLFGKITYVSRFFYFPVRHC